MTYSSITEQVAQSLRDGIRQGRWQETIPGRNRLAAELGVNHKTANAALGILETEGVSLICSDPDSTFGWCRPTVAHVAWDSRPVINRVARWAKNISQGKNDRRQSFSKAQLVLGGTIGPAPKR